MLNVANATFGRQRAQWKAIWCVLQCPLEGPKSERNEGRGCCRPCLSAIDCTVIRAATAVRKMPSVEAAEGGTCGSFELNSPPRRTARLDSGSK